jgi:hypothetical protein
MDKDQEPLIDRLARVTEPTGFRLKDPVIVEVGPCDGQAARFIRDRIMGRDLRFIDAEVVIFTELFKHWRDMLATVDEADDIPWEDVLHSDRVNELLSAWWWLVFFIYTRAGERDIQDKDPTGEGDLL